MLAREAAVSAVSLAAKNADTKRQIKTTENVIQSMRAYSPARTLPFLCRDRYETERNVSVATLVLRFRSSPALAAPRYANFGIQGALAN
jgi:hypothetical protein